MRQSVRAPSSREAPPKPRSLLLRPALVAARDARPAATTSPPASPRPAIQLPFDEPKLELVPTTAEVLRLLGTPVHQLTRAETLAWSAEDASQRDEMRRAIRESVREQGGGELRDYRGRVLERIA